jgi:hypothetical protein
MLSSLSVACLVANEQSSTVDPDAATMSWNFDLGPVHLAYNPSFSA